MNGGEFLYSKFNTLSEESVLEDSQFPDQVANNLNPRFGLREYQHEAFKRFIYHQTKYSKKLPPTHLLFNMATGSGKTLVMAGLILYLYTQGYRNFLFFVNTTNIIDKTRDNFLNPFSSKYLFNSSVNFDGKIVGMQEVNSFQESNPNSINICFTTIQKLHGDLHKEKENCLTFDDFKDQKIVLLSDEAHHMQAATKQKSLSTKLERPNWENTVEKILEQNVKKNMLLEFTATLSYRNKGVVEKYRPKVIYRYDLKKFCSDGYGKDIHILRSDLGEKERMLQAIIISQYRQELAGKAGITLKPVILFKAKMEIAESKKNQVQFDNLIDNLDESDIENIRPENDESLLGRAFQFFSDNKTSDSQLVRTLKNSFAPKYCLNVNDKNLDIKSTKQLDRQELIAQQYILNSLEDNNNPIRAIFAVHKLNEGWDVLNLFDIVRLNMESSGNAGNTTIAEAQLIGRGARYFPFVYKDKEIDKRKFDKDIKHSLRILEEMHYHSVNDSAYILELKTELKDKGFNVHDEDGKDGGPLELFVKKAFKKKAFYKEGQVYVNEQVKNTNEKVKSFKDLEVKRVNVKHRIATRVSTDETVFADAESAPVAENKTDYKKVSLQGMEIIVRKAMAQNSFYNFDNLKEFFPNIKSSREFATSKNYMGGLEIIFEGKREVVENPPNRNKLAALTELLREIEMEVKANTTAYKGTPTFKPKAFREIFVDKKIKRDDDEDRTEGQKDFLADKDWYVFNANYGTSEERKFVRMMSAEIDSLCKEHEEVYLVRNEQHFKIYNFKDGMGHAPDFVLFLKKKGGESIGYQIFIEVKGDHLLKHDKWKEEFLQAIEKQQGSVINLGESNEYKIIGLPFYNYRQENKFKEELHSALERYKKKGASNKRDKKVGVDSPS